MHEELDALARHYHHLHNEIERTDPQSSTRRKLEDRLLQVCKRFGSEAGSTVEIRGAKDEFGVWVDGTLQERIAVEKDLSVSKPVVHFRWDGQELEETFNASEEALRALDEYLGSDGAAPPWEYASELLADGLIDRNFDLTPRGRRAQAWVESLA